MKKRRFLKVMEVLSVFTILFFMAGYSPAQQYNAWIEFDDIDQLAEDAQYIQWEIKASKTYDVVVYMVDDDGDNFTVIFRTADGSDSSASDSFLVKIGDDYYDTNPSKETFEADLDAIINDDWDEEHSYTSGDPDAKIKKIRIMGNDFSLYSITLADNDNFDDPCWQIDVSEMDWDNNDDFKDDDGNFSSSTYISYNSSNIHIEEILSGVGYPSPWGGGYPYGGGPYSAYYRGGYPYGGSYPYGSGYPYGGRPYPSFGTLADNIWHGSPYGGYYGSGYTYGGRPYPSFGTLADNIWHGSPSGGYYSGGYPYGGNYPYGSGYPYGGSPYGGYYGSGYQYPGGFPGYLQGTNPWAAYDPIQDDPVTFAPGSSWPSPFPQPIYPL